MTTTSNPGRKPTHRIYRVVGEGKNASWTPIGAAWPNQDGMGFSITCDAIPLQGRLVMRVITERTMTGAVACPSAPSKIDGAAYAKSVWVL